MAATLAQRPSQSFITYFTHLEFCIQAVAIQKVSISTLHKTEN